MMTARRRLRTNILLLVLFLAAFVPRAVYPVSRPLQWYDRSFRFIDAVLHGRWADTLVSEHPGVTPMWLIGLAQHGYYAVLRALGQAPPHPLDVAGRAFQVEVAISILPLAAGLALGVLLIWWLLKNLFGERVAWAGAGLAALDPFHIAISKVVHVDALLSVLMILSALALLYHLKRDEGDDQRWSFWSRYRSLLASGALAGLAFLTKSPAYFLVPFLGLSLLMVRGRRARLWRGYVVPVLLWAGAAAVTYVSLWPAMWVQPVQTLATVVGGIFKHTGRAHPQPLYYLGELTTEDPGPGFYGLTLLVKTTVLSLPLCLVGLFSPLTAAWRRQRRWLGLLIAYLVFFFVQMSLGAKKAPRYLLPAFPALDIIAAVGLVTLLRYLASRRPRVSSATFIGAALAVQAALVWPYHPYYITHASLLVGGPAGAQHILMATPEGEGLDLVARFLNRLPEARQLRVGVQLPAREAFRQYFVGQVADTRESDLDYLVFADVYVKRHMAEDQWGEQWEKYRYRRPEYTAYLHGLPYAWLYRVSEGPQPADVALPVCLGEHMRLLGYTLLRNSTPLDGRVVHPGESLQLTLHWAATGTPTEDYSVFVHMLGPGGALVTQQDNPPLRGTYPTYLWQAGDRVEDPYELEVPLQAAAGEYTLVAGVYDWRTGERLAAKAGCTSRLAEDRVELARFGVRPVGLPWWNVLAGLFAAAVAGGGVIVARPTIRPIRQWIARCWMPLTYALLTLAMTYPAVFRLGTHYVGTGGDLLIFPWNDWWCRKCLLEGHNPFFTTWLFYPRGVSLVYHNFAWLNTGLWLPLAPLIGPVAAHNTIFLFNLTLGGVGMYLLVHYLSRDRRAAFVAGLVFAFWPVRMSHYNHPNMVSVGWVPLFLLFLIRTVREEPKLKPALLAGLFLALTGLARWLHLMFAGGMAVAYLVYSVLFERRCWNRRTVLALAVAFGLAVVIMSPLLGPLVMAQVRDVEGGEDVFSTDPDLYSTDLISYFVPDRAHPLFRPWLSDLWDRMRRGAYLGYSALVLAMIGLLKGRRDRGLWLLVGAGMFVLALGPQLQVAGRPLDVRLPYAWVQDWAPVRVVRHPNRFTVLLSLPLAVLVGYGVAWLVDRVRRPGVWTAGLGLLLLFEYLPWPYPTVQPSVPPFYRQLAQELGEFAILDLPMGARTVAKPYMYYATLHGKPLVEGHVSRLPVSAYDFIDSVPLLYGLHRSNEMDPALGDVSRQLSALAEAGVRYMILHPKLVPADQLARWRDWLAIEPAFEDPDTVVYRTQPEYGRDFEFVGEVGDGIGLVKARLSAALLPQDGWLKAELVWGSRGIPEWDWLARLALVSPSGAAVQRVDFEPCAGWPASQWGADSVARGHGSLRVDPFIEGGTYTVTVRLVDPATGALAGQPLSVGHVEVQAIERVFERPAVEVPIGVLFDDALRLVGYDVGQGAGALHLTLHWRAERRMDVAYKFFVHVLDPGTGELVAQADVMPRDWGYPTNWWEKGEYVSDQITLSVSGVPPGAYRVMIGVYDPETGARLPVAEPGRGDEAGDRWLLMERWVLP